MMRASVREQVDAAVKRRSAELIAKLPPLTREDEQAAAAIFATVLPRRRPNAA